MLNLSFPHRQVIQRQAETCYPHECCGLLLGKREADLKIVREVIPTENSWDESMAATFAEISGSARLGKTARERYAIAPFTLLQIQKSARSRNLEIIGVYHSHPDHPAFPSEFDRAIAWPEYSYIIVSVGQNQVADLRCWSLDEFHQFQPENILNTD